MPKEQPDSSWVDQSGPKNILGSLRCRLSLILALTSEQRWFARLGSALAKLGTGLGGILFVIMSRRNEHPLDLEGLLEHWVAGDVEGDLVGSLDSDISAFAHVDHDRGSFTTTDSG